jgi:hypothetical protein
MYTHFDKNEASLEYKIVGLKPPSVHKMKTTKLRCNTEKEEVFELSAMPKNVTGCRF